LKALKAWAIIKQAKALIGKIPEKQGFRTVYQALEAGYHIISSAILLKSIP